MKDTVLQSLSLYGHYSLILFLMYSPVFVCNGDTISQPIFSNTSCASIPLKLEFLWIIKCLYGSTTHTNRHDTQEPCFKSRYTFVSRSLKFNQSEHTCENLFTSVGKLETRCKSRRKHILYNSTVPQDLHPIKYNTQSTTKFTGKRSASVVREATKTSKSKNLVISIAAYEDLLRIKRHEIISDNQFVFY